MGRNFADPPWGVGLLQSAVIEVVRVGLGPLVAAKLKEGLFRAVGDQEGDDTDEGSANGSASGDEDAEE